MVKYNVRGSVTLYDHDVNNSIVFRHINTSLQSESYRDWRVGELLPTNRGFICQWGCPPCTFIPDHPIGVIQTNTNANTRRNSSPQKAYWSEPYFNEKPSKAHSFYFSKAIYTTLWLVLHYTRSIEQQAQSDCGNGDKSPDHSGASSDSRTSWNYLTIASRSFSASTRKFSVMLRLLSQR